MHFLLRLITIVICTDKTILFSLNYFKLSYNLSMVQAGDSQDVNEHFLANFIPFEIKFRLPKLRKERIISDRDEFGRIIVSKVPTRRLFR